jgi:ech hydrogenase subunit A
LRIGPLHSIIPDVVAAPEAALQGMHMLTLPVLLIVIPLVVGAGMLGARTENLRRMLAITTVVGVCLCTVLLAILPAARSAGTLSINHHLLEALQLLVDVGLAAFIIRAGLIAKSTIIVLLAAVQAIIMIWFGLAHGSQIEIEQNLYIDLLAILMALINGLVGSAIFLYALSYMKEYHEHAHSEVPDRRPMFFSILFVFMGAMFGLVFSNNLLWLGIFWEITTLCSFLLIGYSQTDEAKKNSALALKLNMLGGVAFSLAVVWFFHLTGKADLQSLITSNKALALLPAALFCFAGMTKSAQLPFSKWLLGAMVAPTPVSALLHSSTMVKAGVYLVLRMAPIVEGTSVGMVVAIVGGLTFLIGSISAIAASDAKRLLAHSTIANLGLIVMCGGLGTAQAVWAGVLLILFHAVAKCLLFLCVGVVEHKLHSRNIEDMAALVVRMPLVAVMMLVGMAGMFLAPFGMLISKWAALKAIIDASPMLVIFLVFGSSATLFFWVKWMGKLLQVVGPVQHAGKEMHGGEYIALGGLTAATFATCLFFPLISSQLVAPYVQSIYGESITFSTGNLVIMGLMMALVLLFPFGFLRKPGTGHYAGPYLGGANTDRSDEFIGSGGAVQTVAIGNYYLHELISESMLALWGTVICSLLLTLMIWMAFK